MIRISISLLSIFILLLPFMLRSQSSESKVYQIKKAIDKINIDADDNEDSWKSADILTNLFMKFPTNDSLAPLQSEVRITHDDKNIYFYTKVYNSSNKYWLQTLKRDKGLIVGDGIGIVLDPFNQKTNGFYFSVSSYNSQTDGLISANDEFPSFSWDNKWQSTTKVYDNYWVAEMAIPFSILRYDDTKKVWGINIIRSNTEKNEFHTWTQIPLQFRGIDLGYLGALQWDVPPPPSRNGAVINPYISTNTNNNKEDKIPTSTKLNAGADVKYAVSSSLNLDLTFNPDFSQADVDEQVTNLTRYDIFFPERRVFFLENDDIFSSYGIPIVRPFYSRRLGFKDGENVPIWYGARLSGNVAKKTRIGIMHVGTGREGDIAGDNFTSLNINQRVLSRSNVKAYFNDRTSRFTDQEKVSKPFEKYGRNTGFEINYSNQEGTIQGWSLNNFSWKPNLKNKNYYGGFGGGYFGKSFTSLIDFQSVGTNYYADMGFVNRVNNYDAVRDTTIRQGYQIIYNETSYTFWTEKSSLFNKIELNTENFFNFDDKRNFIERNNEISLEFGFKNTANIEFEYNTNKTTLQYPFRFVSDEDSSPLPIGYYHSSIFGINIESDRRKNLNGRIGFSKGKYFGADFTKLYARAVIRKQPYVSFILYAEFNKLDFATPYGRDEFLLVSPQFEWNFTNNLFWTNFLQFNSQANNFNINSRLQWRYSPMSDLFIVFSDNYFTDPLFENKNRALVLKLNYWLNV
jgi:hypothetical protein